MQVADRTAVVINYQYKNCELIACTAPSTVDCAEYRISTLAKKSRMNPTIKPSANTPQTGGAGLNGPAQLFVTLIRTLIREGDISCLTTSKLDR